MTWQTPDGERWLMDAEAHLVRETLAYMVDQISENIRFGDDECLWDFDVELFAQLTSTQQLVVLKGVAEHLLTETDQTLELTAINEAAVYTIFRTLAIQIEIEVDTERDKEAGDPWRCNWRSMTLDAYRECCADDDEEEMFADDEPERSLTTPQSEQSCNVEQWESLTESLADRILWDRDFEMAGNFLDTEPAKAAVLKQMMGIESDYYSSAAPDLRTEEVQDMLRSVRQLTHKKPR